MSTAVAFTPGLAPADRAAAYWVRQAALRLRREVAWVRHAREGGGFPAPGDRGQWSLDLTRFHGDRAAFFASDPAAAWLTEQIEEDDPSTASVEHGGFGWAADALGLDDFGRFVLALGAAAAFDPATGGAVAAAMNLTSPAEPTLALAQHLWDHPEAALAAADPAHPLFASGLLQGGGPARGGAEWERPLRMAPAVARQLLFPGSPLPPALLPLDVSDAGGEDDSAALRLVASRLAEDAPSLRVVPIRGPRGAGHAEVAASVARRAGRKVARFRGDPALLRDGAYLDSLAALCWLAGTGLYLDDDLSALLSDEHHGGMTVFPSPSIPAVVHLAVGERRQLPRLPAEHLLPLLDVPTLAYEERVAAWEHGLGPRAAPIAGAIAEAARRFRFGRAAVARVCEALKARPGTLAEDDLVAACRAEADLDMGDLAQRVEPRFAGERVLLPPAQARQLDEVRAAMSALTEVHYRWGTARAWNEGGITALFAGPPGTGKTMAAEVLAADLGLPMYRIDLSQVVNKYIGETEKNLKRLFDAADVSDLVLFFDEADSLFGKRTEVKDAHDRYANLEVSYLLERMERFKGLAILATNRRKDLDEAFLRRLRFVIEFPLPDETRRREMWAQMVPAGVDASEADFGFLARRFPLAGGHIRSIVFNACLQSARRAREHNGDGAPKPRLAMPELVAAVKREYDKLNRPIGLEHFGPYAPLIEEMSPRHEAR